MSGIITFFLIIIGIMLLTGLVVSIAMLIYTVIIIVKISTEEFNNKNKIS